MWILKLIHLMTLLSLVPEQRQSVHSHLQIHLKIKPSIHSIVTNECDDWQNPAADFKVESDRFAVTWTLSSSGNSKDKLKAISQAKIQNMCSYTLVQKTSKSLEPKKERAGNVEKGTSPNIVTCSESWLSKQDKEICCELMISYIMFGSASFSSESVLKSRSYSHKFLLIIDFVSRVICIRVYKHALSSSFERNTIPDAVLVSSK